MAEKESRSPTRWDPLAELEGLSSWSPLRELMRAPRWGGLAEELGKRGMPMPAIDITEDDDEYVVTAELPGSRKEDVTLELHEGVLTLRGEKRNEREEKKEQRRYVERSYGSFSRSFTLPPNVDPDRISASFKEGVLSITLPKTPEAKPRTVSIGS
jgi:HSP20 family protein